MVRVEPKLRKELLKWPSVPKSSRLKQYEWKNVADIERTFKELSKHACHDVTAPLLNLCFERQEVEKQHTATENKLRKLDARVNEELSKLARKVSYDRTKLT